MHHTGRAGKGEPGGVARDLDCPDALTNAPARSSACRYHAGPSPRKNGTADLGPLLGVGVLRRRLAEAAPEHLGVDDAGVHRDGRHPLGELLGQARVRPSMAHLVAQYGATSGDVERPHPELRLAITPEPRAIIAGAKWRITLATPLMFTSITRSKSAAGTSHRGALRLIERGVVDQQVGRTVLGDDAIGPGLHRQVVRHVQRREVVRMAERARRCPIASAVRPQPTTRWPARARPSASARPRPRVTPVIATTLTVPFVPSPCDLPPDSHHGTGIPRATMIIGSAHAPPLPGRAGSLWTARVGAIIGRLRGRASAGDRLGRFDHKSMRDCTR